MFLFCLCNFVSLTTIVQCYLNGMVSGRVLISVKSPQVARKAKYPAMHCTLYKGCQSKGRVDNRRLGGEGKPSLPLCCCTIKASSTASTHPGT